MTRTLHLIRHASYDMLDRVLAGRAPGHSLSDAGRTEAERLARDLDGIALDAIVSSPVTRAQETARPLAGRRSLPVRTDAAFEEIGFGAWTGRRFDALHEDPAWRRWNSLRSLAAAPGGETMFAAQFRAIAGVLALAEVDVAIFTHADIVKSLLAYFLGMPLDLFRRIEIAPASRSVVRLLADDVRVDAVNIPVSMA